eukprot:COSAG06_NODE_23540_length_688_cov_5.480475_1_plen_162_part_00
MLPAGGPTIRPPLATPNSHMPSLSSNSSPSYTHPRQTRVCLGWPPRGPLAPIYCGISDATRVPRRPAAKKVTKKVVKKRAAADQSIFDSPQPAASPKPKRSSPKRSSNKTKPASQETQAKASAVTETTRIASSPYFRISPRPPTSVASIARRRRMRGRRWE